MENSEISLETRNQVLDALHKNTFGLNFSKYKAVISGSVMEEYHFEKSIHYGGTLGHHKISRKRNSGIRRSFSISRARLRIRRLISANSARYGCKDLFVTFTFAENITSLKEANACWTAFIKRLKYHLGFNPAYVAVVEFQQRGAVHYHAVFFNIPFIEDIKDKWAEIWSHGFISIKSIKKINSIGAYLSKYLQKGVVDARLFNEKCYFSSRGLHKPFTIREEPLEIDGLVEERVNYELKEIREYYSEWTGKITYKLYNKVKNE